jgi:hypothetical protein
MTELPAIDELTANQYAVADAAVKAAAVSPQSGWSAGQVVAHLILNNGLFVEAARAAQRGEKPAYDNWTTVDDVAVASLAAAAGSTEQLAEWLRQSANGYAGFLSGLPQELLEQPLITTIHHDGALMVDHAERRLGDLMLGQLTFHSQMHLDQVQQLA